MYVYVYLGVCVFLRIVSYNGVWLHVFVCEWLCSFVLGNGCFGVYECRFICGSKYMWVYVVRVFFLCVYVRLCVCIYVRMCFLL